MQNFWVKESGAYTPIFMEQHITKHSVYSVPTINCKVSNTSKTSKNYRTTSLDNSVVIREGLKVLFFIKCCVCAFNMFLRKKIKSFKYRLLEIKLF